MLFLIGLHILYYCVVLFCSQIRLTKLFLNFSLLKNFIKLKTNAVTRKIVRLSLAKRTHILREKIRKRSSFIRSWTSNSSFHFFLLPIKKDSQIQALFIDII